MTCCDLFEWPHEGDEVRPRRFDGKPSRPVLVLPGPRFTSRTIYVYVHHRRAREYALMPDTEGGPLTEGVRADER